MRKNQYFRFYPTKGRRIKKIRGYVRMKYRSDVKALDECCDDSYEDDPIFEAAYTFGPDSICYCHIIEWISLHLNSLRISHSLSYDTINKILTIHHGNESIKVNLDEIVPTAIKLKLKSITDYIRRTTWVR